MLYKLLNIGLKIKITHIWLLLNLKITYILSNFLSLEPVNIWLHVSDQNIVFTRLWQFSLKIIVDNKIIMHHALNK